MAKWTRGNLVELDGLLAVVVGIEGDPDVPEEHVALWFGDPTGDRTPLGGTGRRQPELWTVPADYLRAAAPPVYRH